MLADCTDVVVPEMAVVDVTITENDYRRLMRFSENCDKSIDVLISEYIAKLPA